MLPLPSPQLPHRCPPAHACPPAGRWSGRWCTCRASWPTSARGGPRPACWTTSRCGGMAVEVESGSGIGAPWLLWYKACWLWAAERAEHPPSANHRASEGPRSGGLGCLQVDVYGDRLPLKACGSVSVRDPQLLAITVFDQDVSGRGGWAVGCPGTGWVPWCCMGHGRAAGADVALPSWPYASSVRSPPARSPSPCRRCPAWSRLWPSRR